MQEEQLLNEYKKYDYLNQDKNNPLVKIFVSYIKPSFLFKSEILTPIHLGRAVEKENSKDGKITEEDINWLHENCIGDDDFEGNISHVNRRVGFLTGTYWAWKNYEKLGNPEYFGSFGYRRFLQPNFFENIKEYDLIIPPKVQFARGKSSLKKHIIDFHGERLYNAVYSMIEIFHNDQIEDFISYVNTPICHLYELYIMKKDLFFKFCEWIFPMLFELLKTNEQELKLKDEENNIAAIFMKRTGEMRDIAYAMEFLTGYFCHAQAKKDNIKTCYPSLIVLKNKQLEKKQNKIVADILRKNFLQKKV